MATTKMFMKCTALRPQNSREKMREIAIDAWTSANKTGLKKDYMEAGETHLLLGQMENDAGMSSTAFHRSAVLFKAAAQAKK